MATCRDIARALAAAIESGVDLSGLENSTTGLASIRAVMTFTPSVPAIDIYPADPSAEDSAFGPGESLQLWTVRARVNAIDEEGNQEILLALREPSGVTSLREAILTDDDLRGMVEGLDVDWPTGYQPYRSLVGTTDASHTTTFLGCEWRVRMYVDTGPAS